MKRFAAALIAALALSFVAMPVVPAHADPCRDKGECAPPGPCDTERAVIVSLLATIDLEREDFAAEIDAYSLQVIELRSRVDTLEVRLQHKREVLANKQALIDELRARIRKLRD